MTDNKPTAELFSKDDYQEVLDIMLQHKEPTPSGYRNQSMSGTDRISVKMNEDQRTVIIQALFEKIQRHGQEDRLAELEGIFDCWSQMMANDAYDGMEVMVEFENIVTKYRAKQAVQHTGEKDANQVA